MFYTEFLEKSIAEYEEALFKRLYNNSLTAIKYIKEENITDIYKWQRKNNIRLYTEFLNYSYMIVKDPSKVALVERWEEKIQNKTKIMADRIREAYIHKVASKFLEAGIVLNDSIQGEQLGDGSVINNRSCFIVKYKNIEFMFKTAIVQNQTKDGDGYLQYPLTFHDLIVDGKSIKKSVSARDIRNIVSP